MLTISAEKETKDLVENERYTRGVHPQQLPPQFPPSGRRGPRAHPGPARGRGVAREHPEGRARQAAHQGHRHRLNLECLNGKGRP